MYDEKRLKNWSASYWNHVKRNIGIVKIVEQEKLRNTLIAVLGVGGLGGPLAVQLVRAGCEKLIICDNERFEEANLNRQLCTREDLGRYKVDVTEKLLKKINPEIELQKYYKITKKFVSNILNSTSIVVLTLDDPIASILISRECLKKNIPILESWGIPYLCAWWFTSGSIDYETCYGFETQKMTIDEIQKSEKILLKLKKAFLNKLIKFPEIEEIFNREQGALEGLFSGNLPSISLAPIVEMTASYLAFEVIFSGILKIKSKNLAPNVVGYDYFRMKPIHFNFLQSKKNKA